MKDTIITNQSECLVNNYICLYLYFYKIRLSDQGQGNYHIYTKCSKTLIPNHTCPKI